MCDNQKYVKIYSANAFYLIFRYVNGSFGEINGSNYLTLVSTDESKGKKIKNLKSCGLKSEI